MSNQITGVKVVNEKFGISPSNPSGAILFTETAEALIDFIDLNLPLLQNKLISDISDQVNKLGPGFSAYSINVSIVSLNATNSELDATFNSDSTVQLDVPIREISGSFSVAVPQHIKDGITGLIGAAAAGPIGGLFGSVLGGVIEDPRFSFTAIADIQMQLVDPNVGFSSASDDPNYFVPMIGPQVLLPTIQFTAANEPARFASHFFSLPHSSPPTPVPGQMANNLLVTELAQALKEASAQLPSGASASVQVGTDPSDGMLIYLVTYERPNPPPGPSTLPPMDGPDHPINHPMFK
jgi:hypothetical protein